MTRVLSRVGIGVDVGTQGVRVIAVDESGRILGRAQERWPLQVDESDFREQNPTDWWSAIGTCVPRVASTIPHGHPVTMTVAATSGTLVLADHLLKPVRPAIMWNDKRARVESDELNAARADGSLRGTTAFRPTFTLSKALWVMRNEPQAFSRAAHILSAGDWILSLMHGRQPVTDYTNALKTGVNLEKLQWPTELEVLGINLAHLPTIVAPGQLIGRILPAVAEAWSLPAKTQIVAGMTDASAAQVASGAVDTGEWVSTIGTGLSIKGNSPVRLEDASGAVYSHRHWSCGWVPSATSHSGADAIGIRFAGEDLGSLTRTAATLSLSSVLVLPLTTVGEFFPFYAPKARGFELGSSTCSGDLFRGYLEGIAFVERLAMEEMHTLGLSVTGPQVTMGGGAQNTVWMGIRASVLQRSIVRPVETSSAFGAAIIALAASPQEISVTAQVLVKYNFEALPRVEAATAYHDRYGEFLDELSRRGYLNDAPL